MMTSNLLQVIKKSVIKEQVMRENKTGECEKQRRLKKYKKLALNA